MQVIPDGPVYKQNFKENSSGFKNILPFLPILRNSYFVR